MEGGEYMEPNSSKLYYPAPSGDPAVEVSVEFQLQGVDLNGNLTHLEALEEDFLNNKNVIDALLCENVQVKNLEAKLDMASNEPVVTLTLEALRSSAAKQSAKIVNMMFRGLQSEPGHFAQKLKNGFDTTSAHEGKPNLLVQMKGVGPVTRKEEALHCPIPRNASDPDGSKQCSVLGVVCGTVDDQAVCDKAKASGNRCSGCVRYYSGEEFSQKGGEGTNHYDESYDGEGTNHHDDSYYGEGTGTYVPP